MAKYLEYETTSGRIVSEIQSATQPTPSRGCECLEVPDDAEIDTTQYIVRNEVLVKQSEVEQERLRQAKQKQERRESIRERLKGMMYEVCICILEDDEAALKELRKEYKEMKVYL